MDPAMSDTDSDSVPEPSSIEGSEPPAIVDDSERAVDEFSFLVRDVNHDGVLSEDEFDEGRSLFDKLADPDRFERYDVNNDGSITREEFLAGQRRDRDREQNEANQAEIRGETAD